MTLHILNLSTTLAPATALARYHTQTSVRSLNALGDAVPGSRKVDITSPAIANVLATLAQTDITTPIENDTDLIVKISPPVYVRVVPPTLPATEPTGEMFENFMTSWTRLVGDPVISKWIVVVLAISVALNGYLIKGIAAGGIGGLRPQMVRFRSVGGGKRAQEKQAEAEAALIEEQKPIMPAVVKAPVQPTPIRVLAPTAMPATPSRAQFLLGTVDEKLRQQAARDASKSSPSSETSSDAGGSVIKETSTGAPMRSLEECIDIFENGPRPVSVSLSLLTDEEVIMLAQKGKIAAYALEKVLGDLERAVFVRRALICEFHCLPPSALC